MCGLSFVNLFTFEEPCAELMPVCCSGSCAASCSKQAASHLVRYSQQLTRMVFAVTSLKANVSARGPAQVSNCLVFWLMSLLFLHEKLSSGFAGSSICSNHFQISSLVFWDGMWWCFSICKYLISEVCSLAMHWHFSTTFLFYLCCVLDFSWQCSKRTSTTLVKLRRCAKDYVSKLAFATTLQCRWTCACTCIRVFSTRQSRSQ